MRVIFMGTPDFAATALKALIGAEHEIVGVYAQPPRPAGRGKKLRPSPVQLTAEAAGLTVRTPVKLRDPEALAEFAAIDADIAMVVAYGMLLPKEALDAPRLGCMNLHASLLPRWRGAAPIQRAIMAGDAETGVCAMRMTEGLDEGPVYDRVSTPIGVDETAQTLHDRLAELGAALMLKTLSALEAGEAAAEEQPSEGVVYAKKINKSEAAIDWSQPAEEIDRQVRGLSPSPGAWFLRDGERTKLLLAQPERLGEKLAPAGDVLDEAGLIACGTGGLRIKRVQRAGRGAVDAAEYLRGAPLSRGDMVESAPRSD
ncbi:MAG: methionyl-tRNA formyltransferase [Neomegalonema sp.]|nr:methionyl-tRNA formyltransferase [Neomegalonema sp.]